MNTTPRTFPLGWPARVGLATLAIVAVVGVSACGHVMMMMGGTGALRPPASEFGLGPRTSTRGLYTTTLQPSQPLRPRQMQAVRVAVADSEGRAIDDATIAVDGGMPQHGHGLPTRPRVTKHLGEGVYEIEGVRFNMGGWWELTLTITGAAGADRVTFNLHL
jgi:hypothetical protein